MIPPATVSTLRSTEIIVACVINVNLTRTIPEPFQIIGSSLVFLAVLSLIFEEQLSKSIVNLFCSKYNTNIICLDQNDYDIMLNLFLYESKNELLAIFRTVLVSKTQIL